ncbi:MAG: MBL fold metallo-hydrolase [Kiritimatiellae bacterium]|nr:MBL fold metallo-hydrolase [Kiritimatiellia bacterium]
MKIRQIRNATLRVTFGGVNFIIDPWLPSRAEGFTFGGSPFASEVVDPAQLDIVMPMCELPVPLSGVLEGVDATILTHLHPDHFDMAPDGSVGARLDKSLPIFVQNEDEIGIMKKSGFADARLFTGEGVKFRGVTLRRTYAKHGTKAPCGPASGVILSSPDEKKTLWILGDTVWCDEVASTLKKEKPDVLVLNSCAAQLKSNGRLIMDDADVESVCRAAPDAVVIASHMDTVAHATLTRKTLRAALERRGLASRVLMPDDGEEYVIG